MGLALYYLDLNGNVMVAHRSDLSDPWQSGVAVDIDIAFAPTAVDISRDQRTLLITAEPNNVRAGIYKASRPSLNDAFNEPTRIDALEGPFSSARFGSQDREIFMSAPFLGSPSSIGRASCHHERRPMSKAERDKWNAIYRERAADSDQAVKPPAELLSRIAHHLPSEGRAIDLAGGGGRNALWFAERGFDVVLADIAPSDLPWLARAPRPAD